MPPMDPAFYVPAITALASTILTLCGVIGVLWRRTIALSDEIGKTGPSLATALLQSASAQSKLAEANEETQFLVQELFRAVVEVPPGAMGRLRRPPDTDDPRGSRGRR